MKETPKARQIREDMRPGKLSLPGFLGDDHDLMRRLDADNEAVKQLNLTHARLAARMRELRDAGTQGLGEFTSVPPHFEVRVDSARGRIPCPFGDRGLFPKTNITVRNLESGRELSYTDLHIHLIATHGFYEGRGTPFRLEPADLVAVLEVPQGMDVASGETR
jgi:hypothetical protein